MPLTSSFIATDEWSQNAIASYFTNPPFDDPITVSLITVAFTESDAIDESTIPASANFAPIDSNGGGAVFTDDGARKIIGWEDPVGGWNFLSTGVTDPVTVFGFRVDLGASFIGCKQIPNVLVNANGVTVPLSYMFMREKTQVFEPPGSTN